MYMYYFKLQYSRCNLHRLITTLLHNSGIPCNNINMSSKNNKKGLLDRKLISVEIN